MAEYIEREAFLEQKRKQYCEDCSRRKGFKRGQYKILYEIGEAPCRACEIDDLLNDVEDFPAADVRPVVRASWEEKEKDGVRWYACSVCGEHIPKGRWGQEWHSNFCPNCGARMEES